MFVGKLMELVIVIVKQIQLISRRQMSHLSHFGFIDFYVDTENHLCEYDMRIDTKPSKKQRGQVEWREKKVRHEMNIVKVYIIFVWKYLYLTQCCVQ